jgi:RNA polymerase sigma-70 factor (ECF subfamily)
VLPPTFDEAWKRRALAGNRDAVDTLATEALAPLYRFCYYRVGRRHDDCEEVVQETLVKAIRDLHRYEPARSGDDVFPWLTGLARNEIHRVLNRHKASASLEQFWQRMDDHLRTLFGALDCEPFDDGLLEREETRDMVNATMSQLPAHYRYALEAKYVLGQSVRDIAAAVKTSEKAIESQLTRAREAFRSTFLALVENLSLEPNG